MSGSFYLGAPGTVARLGSRVGSLVLSLGAIALTVMAVAGVSAPSAGGDVAPPGEVVIGVSGETVPHKLPRSRMVPAKLRLGFTSETPGTPTTPELTAIDFEVSRNIAFRPMGLPGCPIAELYSESSGAGQICAGSLVGHGSVISEVTLPGQAPVRIEGRLSAFYDFGEGQPRILAQVTSSGALPLTYVIPFTIYKARGVFGTSLFAGRMRFIKGKCARGHPNCFAQTYTYEGIYGHISKFELTLDRRRFVHAGKKSSVVSADCPAGDGSSSAIFPLVKVELAYAEARAQSKLATRRCEVGVRSAPESLSFTIVK